MLSRVCRVSGTARRAAFSLGSSSPRLDATPAAAARRTVRGDAEKPEEALTIGSSLSDRLPATPAVAAATRRTACAEAEKKPEASPNQRRAGLTLGTSLSPLLAATPAAAAATRRTICTEPEKIPEDLTPNQLWLYRQISDLKWDSTMELYKLRREMLKMSTDFNDKVAEHKRKIAEAQEAATKDILDIALGAWLLIWMALLVVRC